MKKNSLQEKLERYLKGDMSAKEMKKFEDSLMKDNEMLREIALEQELETVLGDADILDLKMKLDAIRYKESRNQMLSPIILSMKSNMKYIAAAASMGVLITAGVLTLTPRNYSSDKLFKMYYQPDKAVIVNRAGRGNVNIVEALMKFQKKEYDAASGMFEEILLNNPDNIALRFYNGISYIETEKYDEAIKSFNLILENKDNLYIEHAEWYLALCYLKKEDVDEARKQLLRIANEEDGFYKEDAQKILEKLDK